MWIMCKTRLLLPFLPGGNKYSVYAEYSLINGYSAVKRRFFDALCKSCRRSKLHIACFAALRADFVPISFTYAKWHLPRVRRIFSAPSRRGRYCYHFFYKIATALPGCNFAKEMGVIPPPVKQAQNRCRRFGGKISFSAAAGAFLKAPCQSRKRLSRLRRKSPYRRRSSRG